MTPDKRLDQVEPVLADVALKTDRLIESNGQILDVATRADTNAKIAAKGIADLTVEMRQQFGQQQNQIDQLRTEMNERFGQVNGRFDQVTGQFEQVTGRFNQITGKFTQVAEQFKQVDNRFDQVTEQFKQVDNRFNQVDNRFEQVIIEQSELRREMNLKFAQVAQTQEQILTLLLDRLK